MERRRVSQGSPMDEDEHLRKRRKQSYETPPVPVRATIRGLFELVWNLQDKNRNVRGHFEELPNKDELPSYYDTIEEPISLAEIRARMDAHGYRVIDDMKKDLHKMVSNATSFNKPKSQVYIDAVRIRSAIEPYGNKKVADLAVQPTPSRTSSRGGTGKNPLLLREAQLRILEDLFTLTDENGDSVAFNFRALPSRKEWPDYFKLIKNPISLNMVKQRAKDPGYKQWSDFEEAVKLIRVNAETFNAAESDIVRDARKLEAFFYRRLGEEKSKLGDAAPPAQSGIKIRLPNVGAAQPNATPQAPPKIKLNVGSKQANHATPARTAEATKPTTNGVRHASPPRHQAPAPAAAAASPAPPTISTPQKQARGSPVKRAPAPAAPAQLSAPTPQAHPLSRSTSATSITSPVHPVTNGVHAAAPDAQRPRSNTPQSHMSPGAGSTMPPPAQRLSVTPRAPSYSPIPSGVASPVAPPTSVPQSMQPRPHGVSDEHRIRDPDGSNSLIANLRITSVSVSNPEDVYTADFPPNPNDLTSQYYINLPGQYQTILIAITFTPNLADRLHRFSVIHRVGSRVETELPPHMKPQKIEIQYNVQLQPAIVNSLVCTAITPTQQQSGSASGWDMERYRLFVMSLP